MERKKAVRNSDALSFSCSPPHLGISVALREGNSQQGPSSIHKVIAEDKIYLNCFTTTVLDTKNEMLISPPTLFFPWDP